VRNRRQISDRRDQDEERDNQPMRCPSVRCKSRSDVRPNPARENPARKKKQKSLNRQRCDSLSHTFRVARVSACRQGVESTGQRIHQAYHDHGCDNTA
jgi:hypothetical protein